MGWGGVVVKRRERWREKQRNTISERERRVGVRGPISDIDPNWKGRALLLLRHWGAGRERERERERANQ